MHEVKQERYSETEKEKLYRLIDEYSHLRDFAGALEHKDRSEIKDAIRILIKVVEGSDERHFESLTNCLSERANIVDATNP